MGLYKFLQSFMQYKQVFGALALLFGFIFISILILALMDKIIAMRYEQSAMWAEGVLENGEFEDVENEQKGTVLRHIAAPNGVDPNTNSYFTVNDAGKDIYYRSFTLEVIPKRTTFAETFADLFNFESCTSSVFIEPMSESTTIRKLDRRVINLEGELYEAENDQNTNKSRKKAGKFVETEGWAREVENGETRFFEVGFLFTIHANTLDELEKLTDLFVSKAREKNMEVGSCFAVQAEAFLSNNPLNTRFKTDSAIIRCDGIKMHTFDQESLSTIYNHTQSDFYHKEGVALGQNMLTKRVVLFDPYDGSHDGYCLIFAGKTGSGKSVTIKDLVAKTSLEKYKFCAIDSQPRGSVGEYAAAAYTLRGKNIQIKADSDTVLNLFEVSETTKMLTDDKSGGAEYTTLELKEKIAEITNNIFSMIRGTEKGNDYDIDFKLVTFMERIIIDSITILYNNFGIYDKEPDSIYEIGKIVENGRLTSGRVKKKMPTMTDFFKLVLQKEKENSNINYNDSYSLIISKLQDYVKELYYGKDTLTYFTKEQFKEMDNFKNSSVKYHTYKSDEDGKEKQEEVFFIHGIRSYYDGQSTVAIDKDCPFTNIDISQLPDSERVLARQIAMSYLNENFVKKNSENPKFADKLCLILDECHENFYVEYCRKTIDNIVRTARKRNVSTWICTQGLVEFEAYTETKSILRNAAAKFVFKQEHQDKEYLQKVLNLTDSQVELLLSLGGSGDHSDLKDKNARRGEVCIVDNRRVAFCKIAYEFFKETEAYMCETSADEVKKIFQQRDDAA